MSLSPNHRSYLIREHVIGAAVINFVLNALIGWAMFRPLGAVPVWGDPAAVPDLVATMFVLPLVVTTIVTLLVRLATRAGKAPALPQGLSAVPRLQRLPTRLWLRALAVAATTVVVVGIPLAALFYLTGAQALTLVNFALIKGGLCAVVAALLSPPIALRAIAETSANLPEPLESMGHPG